MITTRECEGLVGGKITAFPTFQIYSIELNILIIIWRDYSSRYMSIIHFVYLYQFHIFLITNPEKSARCVHEYERSTTFEQQKNVNKYDQYTFLFLFSFTCFLKVWKIWLFDLRIWSRLSLSRKKAAATRKAFPLPPLRCWKANNEQNITSIVK